MLERLGGCRASKSQYWFRATAREPGEGYVYIYINIYIYIYNYDALKKPPEKKKKKKKKKKTHILKQLEVYINEWSLMAPKDL